MYDPLTMAPKPYDEAYTEADQSRYRMAVPETESEYRLIVEPTEEERAEPGSALDVTFLAESEENAMRGARQYLRQRFGDAERPATLYKAVTRIS